MSIGGGRRMGGGSDAYTKPTPIDTKANNADSIDILTKLINYDQPSIHILDEVIAVAESLLITNLQDLNGL